MGAETRFTLHATRRGKTPDIPSLFGPQPPQRKASSASRLPPPAMMMRVRLAPTGQYISPVPCEAK